MLTFEHFSISEISNEVFRPWLDIFYGQSVTKEMISSVLKNFGKNSEFIFLNKDGEREALVVIDREYCFRTNNKYVPNGNIYIEAIMAKPGNNSGKKLLKYLKGLDKNSILELYPCPEDGQWLVDYYNNIGFKSFMDEDDDVDYMLWT